MSHRTTPRRKTCRRYDEPGHAHELTFSCFRGLPLLARDRARGWLIEAIEAARRSPGFDLWAYVIMPEHVHVLLKPRPAAAIARILWQLKRPVATRAFAHLRRSAPGWMDRELAVIRRDGRRDRYFWQPGGGYDRNIVDPATARHVADYIHQNPVRRGLVARPEDWPWSSAGWYAGLRPVPVAIDPTFPASSGA